VSDRAVEVPVRTIEAQHSELPDSVSVLGHTIGNTNWWSSPVILRCKHSEQTSMPLKDSAVGLEQTAGAGLHQRAPGRDRMGNGAPAHPLGQPEQRLGLEVLSLDGGKRPVEVEENSNFRLKSRTSPLKSRRLQLKWRSSRLS